MQRVATIGTILAAIALVVLVAMTWLHSCAFSVQTKVDRFKKFAAEFEVGKPSIDFIRRAREMGAEWFIVLPSQKADNLNLLLMGTKNFDNPEFVVGLPHPPFKHDKEALQAYEQHFDRLEAKFRTMRQGSAQVGLTQFMFLTDHCKIDFKDGKVTQNRVFQME
jgi:hypothetical protein